MKRYDKELSAEEIGRLDDGHIDFGDIPELGDRFWRNARVELPEEPKKQITLRLDADVVAWFKASGRGYQTRMNAILRAYMNAYLDGKERS